MKALLVVLLLAVVALAQDQSAVTSAESACGSKEITFETKLAANQHPTPQPEPGKALVYVIEDLGQCYGCSTGGSSFFAYLDRALTKVGMDGSWEGANRGSSYIFFRRRPGEHHLCINWQSRLEIRARAFAMANFTAEEGKAYYFRERVLTGHDDYSFDLDPLNNDQGKYLIALSAFSESHPKK